MQHANTSQARPMRAFHVSLRSAGQRLIYTAIARASGDALHDALLMPGLTPPVAASVRPVGNPADALRLFRAKMAPAGLVEGV